MPRKLLPWLLRELTEKAASFRHRRHLKMFEKVDSATVSQVFLFVHRTAE